MNLKYINKKNILSVTIGVFILVSFSLIYFYNSARAFINPIYTNVTANKTDVSSNTSFCTYLSEENEAINLENAYPVSDNVGLKSTPYQFEILNECPESKRVKIFLVINSETTIDIKGLNYYLSDQADINENVIKNLDKNNLKLNSTTQYVFKNDFSADYKKTTGKDSTTIHYLGSYKLTENEIKQLYLKLWIDKDANVSSDEKFSANIVIENNTVEPLIPNTLSDSILINNSSNKKWNTDIHTAKNDIESIDSSGNFAKPPTLGDISTPTENKMYATLDDFGTSYYFRGAVNDNWVEFAGFYWRIIRIDGQGNIRLIYSGSVDNPGTVSSNGVTMTGSQTEITTSNYYNSYNDPTYVGYQREVGDLNGYGENAVDSNIKEKLDSWYVENIENPGYESYIADAVYCNDRTLYSDMAGGEGNKLDLPISGNNTYYGSYTRLETNKPSLECPDKSDEFRVSNDNNIGNGALDYPIALITMDEIAFAGGKSFMENSSYYLYTNQSYWTLSPYSCYSDGSANVGLVVSTGDVYGDSADSSRGVRAAVSLSSEILYAGGSGTWNDPYVVE